jgi:hypothetical protein
MPRVTVHVIPEEEIRYREYLEELRLRKTAAPSWVLKWAKANLLPRKQRIQESLRKTGSYEDEDIIIQ